VKETSMIGSISNRHSQDGRLRGLPILLGTVILALALAGCEGPAGADGADGMDGLPGKDGKDGRDGRDGTDGQDGENGKPGKDGNPGDDGEQGPPGPAGPATWLSAPGVTLEITGAELTSERKVAITWEITDRDGNPLDRAGRMTEGAYSPSFVVAYFDPAADQFRSLKTRTETSEDEVTVEQATNDSGGTTTDITLGTYEYVTGLTVPADLPANTVIRVHGYASRTYKGVAYVGADVYDFALDGSTPEVRQIVTDAACDTCHGALTAHGRRRGVDGCVTCHTLQTTDAQTGNTVDMATMVHKIHTGKNLPSLNDPETPVGAFYGISGHQGHLYVYGEKTASGVVGVSYLRDTRQCDSCHAGAADADRVFGNPSARACGSCHDDSWTLTEHLPGKQDSTCSMCHSAASLAAIHRTNVEWAADQGITQGLTVELVSVTNVSAGMSPTVQFKLKNADGADVAPSSMATLSAVFGWPMPVPLYNLTGQNLKNAAGPDENGVYTATVAGVLPDTLKDGDTVLVHVDIRARYNATRDGASLTITEAPKNAFTYVVAGTDAVGEARAYDVPMASCESCHGEIGNSPSLSGHGGQRNTMESCVNCHNPSLTDASVRNDGSDPVSVDMPLMIHKIHAGETLSQGYVVFGYGNSVNDFGHIVFTGQLTDCQTCHEGNAWQDPSTRACITCHDSPAAAAHAELNTTAAGVEACTVCHAAGSALGADQIHRVP
jgi:OmcA/MtrC family decaheme c-type cytochrome